MSEMHVPTTIPPLTLGWRLQMSLDYAGISTQQMADELGVVRSTVSRWMHDNGAPPRDGFLRLWALRTGVPYEWLRDGVASSGDPAGPDRGPGLSAVNGKRPRRPVADGGEECAIRDSNAEPAGLAHRRVLPFPAAARLAVAA